MKVNMMRDLTSLDLKFLVPEFEKLKGGRIQKIYQKEKTIWMEVFVSGHGTKYFYFTPGKLFISDKKISAPMNPASFAMLLRKYLSGQKIIDVYQPGFERILNIETEHYFLHLEIFSKGNVILCDKAGVIIQPMEKQHWKDRNIYPGKEYRYPPEILNPFEMGIQEYEEAFKDKKKQIVIFFAIRMGLSGIFAEEICARAGIEKSTPCQDLTEDQVVKLRDTILSIQPRPVMINDTPYPIEMKTVGVGEPIPSFLDELDKFYLKDVGTPEQLPDNRQERILVVQEKSAEKWEQKEEDRKEKAEILQRNFDKVDGIVKGLNDARDHGLSWDEIKQKVKSDPVLSKIISEIKESEGKVILELD
jgi:predicted ribosome quality control (RQC) complex YloA/Tae2 family protein